MNKFNIYKNNKGYYYTLTTASGTEIMTSTARTRKHDVKRLIQSTIDAVNAGQVRNASRGSKHSFTVNGKYKNTIFAKSKNWNRSSDVTKAVTNLRRTITCSATVDKTK